MKKQVDELKKLNKIIKTFNKLGKDEIPVYKMIEHGLISKTLPNGLKE